MEIIKHARQCTECDSGMSSGYCVGGGGEYYCSDECLHKHYTKSEWEEMCEDEDSDNYYTEWEDEDDFDFIEVNNELMSIEDLMDKHEAIRQVLIKYGNEEYGDCIIDEICNIVGFPPTTVYYNE